MHPWVQQLTHRNIGLVEILMKGPTDLDAIRARFQEVLPQAKKRATYLVRPYIEPSPSQSRALKWLARVYGLASASPQCHCVCGGV